MVRGDCVSSIDGKCEFENNCTRIDQDQVGLEDYELADCLEPESSPEGVDFLLTWLKSLPVGFGGRSILEADTELALDPLDPLRNGG